MEQPWHDRNVQVLGQAAHRLLELHCTLEQSTSPELIELARRANVVYHIGEGNVGPLGHWRCAQGIAPTWLEATKVLSRSVWDHGLAVAGEVDRFAELPPSEQAVVSRKLFDLDWSLTLRVRELDTPLAREAAACLSELPAGVPGGLVPGPRYRSVTWNGKPMTFSIQQAQALERMHREHPNAVHVTDIQEASESQANDFRMDKLFRDHEAFGTLIVSRSNGMWGLVLESLPP